MKAGKRNLEFSLQGKETEMVITKSTGKCTRMICTVSVLEIPGLSLVFFVVFLRWRTHGFSYLNSRWHNFLFCGCVSVCCLLSKVGPGLSPLLGRVLLDTLCQVQSIDVVSASLVTQYEYWSPLGAPHP